MRIPGSLWPLAVLAIGLPAAYSQGLKARVVHYSKDEIVPIRAKLRYTTVIVLPPNEKILDYVTGDKTYWIINGIANYCFLHPAKAGISSNLNLITNQGHVYSFTLHEISKDPGVEPDLKVFVVPRHRSMLKAVKPDPRFVPASDVRQYQLQAQIAEREARQAEGRFEADYPLRLHFNYKFPRNKRPFKVGEIYEDGRFTYIRSRAATAPALYAISGGKPSLVQFQVRHGVYIVSRVLDKGYLQIGNKRMKFRRRKRAR